MRQVAARDKMQFDDLRLGVICMIIWLVNCSGANPTVTLKPVSSVYFDVGGSLSLVCEVDQDIGVTKLFFTRNNNNQVSIIPSSCTVNSTIIGDLRTYSSTCSQGRIFTLRINGVHVDDHRTTWSCQVVTSSGTCTSSASVKCGIPVLSIFLRVPVTTVQLMTGSGQVLSSSVNIVRGQSTGIRCSTAPNGSRPNATFQWYIRQGNQSPVLIVDQSISLTPDPITVPGQPEADLMISYSTWNLSVNASNRDMYIYCEARDETNTGNYTKSDEVQLNIVYPPVVHLSTYQSIYNVTAYQSIYNVTAYQSIYNVTEGMQNFVFNCNIIEANPLPQANSYSWLYKTVIMPGQTSSTYTLPNVQRSNAGEYRCTASNDYGNGASNSLDLIVQYPPSITVILTGSSWQNQTAKLVCGAMGVPAETAFYPWVQMWRGLVIRTGLHGNTNSTHSVLTLDRLSLESMGTYVCTASNGINGINGIINQTGSEILNIKGAASILTKNAGFVGEITLSANISISFYCDPPIERFAIWKRSKEIMNTSRTMTSLSSDIENYTFYNKAIQLNAQKAHFVILNVTVEDFDNYTLVLMNSFGNTSFQFYLDPFGPPLVVQRFYFNRFIDNQIELHFDVGFNGGSEQTFVIEYMSDTSSDNVWKNTSGPELRENEIPYRFSNGTFFIKFPAPLPGHYIYRMYSWNVKGRSPFSDNITVTVPDKNNAEKMNSVVEAVAGGVGAAVVVLVIIIVVLILLRRRSFLQKKSTAENIDSELINRNHRKSQLADNPVYDPTISRSGTGIAVVTHAEDPSKLYAQVDKTKTNKEKATAKGKHGKTSKGMSGAPSKGKHGKTSRGDIYENATQAVKGSAESEYENPGQLATGPSSGDNVYETTEASASKGKSVGLLYADVILGPPTKKAGKPIIHGEEERTEYAEIAFDKRGEPLPETDEVKETGGAKKNGTK